MDQIYLKARAKVNLSLEVLEKRPDNYHNLNSIFQKVSLYDEMYLTKTNLSGITINTNIKQLNNSNNIIYKAFIKLKDMYKDITGVLVTLKKNIPMQAGMAGGSTDCASFIIGMNRLFNLNMTKEQIHKLGASLGADVVPCFYNSATQVEGIGDKVTRIDTDFKYYIVIIKAKMSCITSEMYKLLDTVERDILIRDNSKNIRKALEINNLQLICDNLYNDFECAIEPKEKIDNIKQALLESGAKASIMTGSGSCIFGVFENKEKAKMAYRKLKKQYESYYAIAHNSKRRIRYD